MWRAASWHQERESRQARDLLQAAASERGGEESARVVARVSRQRRCNLCGCKRRKTLNNAILEYVSSLLELSFVVVSAFIDFSGADSPLARKSGVAAARALRLSEMHWNGGNDLLPDRVLSIGLTDQFGYVVFFNKLTQSAIAASCRFAATAKIRASLSEILNTLSVSLCKGPILAICQRSGL